MMNAHNSGTRSVTVLSVRWLAAAIAVGVAVGLATTLDGPFADTFKWLRLAQQAPYALSALALGIVLAVATGVRRRAALWRTQFTLATVAIVCSLQMMALDIGPINALNILIVLTCALWLLHRLADHAAPWSPSGLFHLTLLFLACTLASALNHDFRDILPGWLTLLPKLALVLVLVDILNHRRQVDLAVDVLIVSSVIAAAIGIAQTGLYVLYQWNLTLMAPDAPRFVTVFGLPLLRAAGLQHTPHGFAQPLAVVALITLLLACCAGGWRRVWLACATTLTLVAVALSVARGQWVGLAFGLVLLPIVAKPRLAATVWLPLGFVLLAVGVGSGLLPWAVGAVAGISDSSGTIRTELIAAGIRAIVNAPTIGVGVGNFGPYSPTVERYPVHNSLVQAASELGIVGGLVFVLVLCWVAVRLFQGVRYATGMHARNQIKALLVGYLCLLVAIQFDPMAYSEFVWFYLVLADSAVRVALAEAAGHAAESHHQPLSGFGGRNRFIV